MRARRWLNIAITYEHDRACASSRTQRQDTYKAALIIPADFTHNVVEGRVGEIGLFTDNVDTISAATLEGVIDQAVVTLRAGFVTAREPSLAHNLIVLPREQPSSFTVFDHSLFPSPILGGASSPLLMGLAYLRRLQLGVAVSSRAWGWPFHLGGLPTLPNTPASRPTARVPSGSSVLITSVAHSRFALTSGPTPHHRRPILAAAAAVLLLVGIIIIGATGILALTFAQRAVGKDASPPKCLNPIVRKTHFIATIVGSLKPFKGFKRFLEQVFPSSSATTPRFFLVKSLFLALTLQVGLARPLSISRGSDEEL